VGWLAMTSGAPVVPVALTGTDRVQPVGSRAVRIAPVRVRFGPPVDPSSYEGLPAGRARREITDEVMERIAALSPQERADAYNEPAGADEVDANTV
jgi:1-acyl-sn-glycerol-3-phosphate acyltransferase